MAHKYPGGELEHILEEALDALLDKVAPERKEVRRQKRDKKRGAKTEAAAESGARAEGGGAKEKDVKGSKARASETLGNFTAANGAGLNRSGTPSRYVPAALKAEAMRSSGGQCTYVSPEGRRCEERRALQFDHVRPFTLGGPSTADNIRCYCRSHNAYASKQTFGKHAPWVVRAV